MVDVTYAQTLAAPTGVQVTPEALALREAYARQLLTPSDQPIHSWSQGVAGIVDALVGGRMANKANQQTYAMRQQAIQQMADALQGGGGNPAGNGMVPGATPQAPAPSPPDTSGGFSGGLAALPVPAAGGAAPAGPPPAPAGAPNNRGMIAAAMNPFLPEGMQSVLLQQAGLTAPTDAMKEYTLAQRQGFKGSMLDFTTQKALASRPVTNIDVSTAGETKFSSDYGSARAAVASDIVDAGDKAASNLQKSNLLAHLLPQAPLGKAAPVFANIGAWLQSLGMDPAAIGIDPKLPATTEAINGLANEMILGKIGKGQFPANNFSEQDRNFLLTTIPQITDRPEAAAVKLEVSRRLDELAIHRADEWEKIANDPTDTRPLEAKFAEFSHDWRDYLQKQNVFSGLDDQLKALSAPAAAPAAPAAADTEAAPPGVDASLWKFMTPDEKALFKPKAPAPAPAAAPAIPAAPAAPPPYLGGYSLPKLGTLPGERMVGVKPTLAPPPPLPPQSTDPYLGSPMRARPNG